MGRYEIIRKNEELRFQEECPLLIVSSAITKDIQKDAILAQIKFLNIYSKKIAAVYIQLQGKGADGADFEHNDEFVYLDLNVDGFTEFGANTPVYLSNIQTRDLTITCQKIVYDDGSVWRWKSETNFVRLSIENPVQNSMNQDAYNELQQELMEQNVCFSEVFKPLSKGNIHLCGCGKYYYGSKYCPYCGKDFEWWNDQIEESELLRKKSLRDEAFRQKAEEEKQQAEQLEKERLQKKEESEKKAKKALKKASVICGIAIVLIIGYVVVSNVIIPSRNYNKACEYAQNGDYENAILWIEKAGTYKDSIVKKEEFVKRQEYQQALVFMNNEQYENAIQIWSALGDFEDSQEQCNKAREKKNQLDYKEACNKIDNKEFEAAEVILTQLGDYQDSVELLKEVHYQQALIKVQKGEYSDAISMFTELKDYKDSVVQSNKAQQKTLENPQPGDIVYSGFYEQDGNIDNGKEPIAWRVLDTWEKGFSAVSVYCLDYRVYLEGNDYLNSWLEDVFTPEAFTAEEQQHVKIRLLELSTLKSDFLNDEDRMASATQYAKDKSGSDSSEDTCEYWYDHKSILNLEKDYEAPLISEKGYFSTTTGQYMLGENYVRPELFYYREPLK